MAPPPGRPCVPRRRRSPIITKLTTGKVEGSRTLAATPGTPSARTAIGQHEVHPPMRSRTGDLTVECRQRNWTTPPPSAGGTDHQGCTSASGAASTDHLFQETTTNGAIVSGRRPHGQRSPSRKTHPPSQIFFTITTDSQFSSLILLIQKKN